MCKLYWSFLLHFLTMLLFKLNYFVLSYSERKNRKLERRLQYASYSLLVLTLAIPPASSNGFTSENSEPHTHSSVVLTSSMGQILSIMSVQTQKQLLVHVISTSGSIYPEFSFQQCLSMGVYVKLKVGSSAHAVIARILHRFNEEENRENSLYFPVPETELLSVWGCSFSSRAKSCLPALNQHFLLLISVKAELFSRCRVQGAGRH